MASKALAPMSMALGITALLLSGLACPAGGKNTPTGGSGGQGAGSGSGSGGSILEIDAGSGGGLSCSPCSADLKSIIDCAGNVVQTCDPGLACAGGACVSDTCEAARQSKSSLGCEYWALNLDNIMPGACFAAYVTNTWTTPIHIQVEHDGKALAVDQFIKVPSGQGSQLTYGSYSAAQGLAPGQVAILFLAQTPQLPAPFGGPCPADITTAITTDPAVHGTGLGKAFRITTDGPVAAYQIFPYGGGNAAITSASLLLPESAWDNNYVAVNAFAATQLTDNWGLPSLDILAREDGTEVTISPVVPITAGTGVAGTGPGQPIKYTLNKGQYVQFTQAAELTGSAIQSTKPVAVFGGNACMNVPVDKAACDTGGQQIPPVRALGHEYAAVRYRGRGGNTAEMVPWRLVGAVDGTALTYLPATPPGAPTSLQYGQAAQFLSPGPFVVKSQDPDHPFYISAHMTGGADFNGEGDPEFVNIVPTAQYLSSYVFFTDPTYPETNLVVVRAPGASGFADVNLDCAGKLGGWMPLGPYEYTRVDLVTGAFQSVNGCANGPHTIESKAPFGVTVWGWGTAATLPYFSQKVSYAYPAGAGVKPVNQTVVPAVPK